MTLSPHRAGVTATLWRWTGRTWAKVVAKTTGADGQARAVVRWPRSPAKYRWTTGYHRGWLPAVSRTVSVHAA